MKHFSVRSTFAIFLLSALGAVGLTAHAATGARTSAALGPATFTGSTNRTQAGAVQVTITVQNDKISQVQAKYTSTNQHTATIQATAISLLKQETLEAGNARIKFVPGATLTSASYVASLQEAINAAKAAHALT